MVLHAIQIARMSSDTTSGYSSRSELATLADCDFRDTTCTAMLSGNVFPISLGLFLEMLIVVFPCDACGQRLE